ncbi:MAG TPA: SMI1/KNR4 family protein [Verrucomicrobiales bacterium]|jgi:cell wall assembly regulator SMI1|nr:SMI1/KNR4 family protein [Verrucomicrobiales bacterium]
MTPIAELIESIRSNPRHALNPPAAEEEISFAEERLQVALPDDLREFYLLSNGCVLFLNGSDFRYWLLPLEDVRPARMLVYGIDDDTFGPGNCFAIADVCDGNYVGALFGNPGRSVNYVDVFHETFAENWSTIIASSFTEFLRRASGSNELYWLRPDFDKVE